MDQPSAKVARLDHDQVYWGLEERAIADIKSGELVFCAPELAEQLPEGAIYVARDCDLPGGQQRWDAGGRCFVPVPALHRKPAPTAPTLEQAFYDFLTIGPDAVRVVAWRNWMKKTMDEAIRK
jgi:hypothetical protein